MSGSFFADFHFLRPWFLLLLLIPLSFYFSVFKGNQNVSSWEKVCDKNLLNYLLIKDKSSKRKIGVALTYLGLILSIVAISGPTWKKYDIPALNNQSPVMIVLNMSSDMLKTDIKPNRLDRAKIEILQLLRDLGSSEVALVAYTNEPFLISPMTSDPEIIINLLDAVVPDIMPINGDRLDRAINLADKKITEAGYKNGNIVVFTCETPMSLGSAISAVKQANKNGNSVNIVNISTTQNDKLKQIASMGDGIYLQSGDNIKLIANRILKQKENYKKGNNKTAQWLDFGWYLLLVVALCCLNFFRKGVLIVVLTLCISSAAEAGFWFNDNFMAMKSFKQKQYGDAAEKFENIKWKGSSYYKDGDFEQAAKLFEDQDDIESMYNYGNALAKSGKIDDAIKVYENVLEKNASHEDAKYNLEYLKQQQQQSQSQNQKRDDKQNNKNNKNSDNQNNQEKQNQQGQNADSEQNQDENKDKEEAKAQSVMSPAQADKENEDRQSQDDSKENQSEQKQETKQSTEEQKVPKAGAKQGPQDEEYDEEVQAKIQKFREIPEDKGGLLRAFVKKEYLKNRYGD